MCYFLWGQSRWCRGENLSVFLALTWSNFQNLMPSLRFLFYHPKFKYSNKDRTCVFTSPGGNLPLLSQKCSYWEAFRLLPWCWTPCGDEKGEVNENVLPHPGGHARFASWGIWRKNAASLLLHVLCWWAWHFTSWSNKHLALKSEISDIGVKYIDGKMCSELLKSFSYKAKIKAKYCLGKNKTLVYIYSMLTKFIPSFPG